MNEAQFVGNVILALITLGSFVAIINKFTQPINELKIVIEKLNSCIEHIKKDEAVQNKRLEKHGIEIDDLKSRVGKVETKLEITNEE